MDKELTEADRREVAASLADMWGVSTGEALEIVTGLSAEGRDGDIDREVLATLVAREYEGVDPVDVQDALAELEAQTTNEEMEESIRSYKKRHPNLIESIRKEEKQKLYGSKAKLKEAKQMSEEKLEELKESLENEKKEKARLQEKLLLREAKDIVAEKLADEKLPEITKNRLLENLSQDPPTEDGEIDKEKFNEAIDEAIKEEVEYLSEATNSGSITGMGESENEDLDEAKIEEELEEELEKLGAKI